MKIERLKKITDKNIDRIITENLYRGYKSGNFIDVQCMNKDHNIIFYYKQEVAVINGCKEVPLEFENKLDAFFKIYRATC